ncbi:hypothetical protein AEQU3_03331 [Aequorivita antarctica]|nr:hypothetical protein AEQU3_03331 [Aequorivita antarctica]
MIKILINVNRIIFNAFRRRKIYEGMDGLVLFIGAVVGSWH